ncbi:MAG: ERAP1-like C-terminal domain-containing protein, partial [Gemmataceae bacterium]
PVRVRVDTPTSTEFHRVLLRNEEARMPLPSGAKAVLVNEGSHGFYRVRYDNNLLEPLLDRLPSLDASERFTLVNDLWAGVLAGMIPLTEFLDRTLLFHGERDRLVWSALLNSQGLLLRLVDDADRPAIRTRIRSLLREAVDDLGWQPRDGEDELRQQLRGDLLRAMGILGDDPAVQREAVLIYTGGQAEANVHSAAVAILAHAGDSARYEEFRDRFRQARTPQEEQRFLLALAGFRPSALVERTLLACRDGSIRTQDAPLVLRTMLQQVHSREATWQFLRQHGDELVQRFPGPGMRRLCEGMTGLISRAWLAEVRAFLQGPAVRLGGKVAEQILEQLEVSVELQSREQAALKDYLRKP